MVSALAITGLVLALWRAVAHVTAPTEHGRAFECRCGRAYRSDAALAQPVALMHPTSYDGARVWVVRGAIRVEVSE